MHYCFLAAPLLSLSPFPFLIGNCSNLPFGTQGRSWRLEFIPNKQEMGNTKRLLYPGAPQSLARFHSAYVHFLGNNFQSICFMCTLFICCVLLQIDVRTLPLLLNILFSEFTKKDVQLESCKLSFIWGKMRTATQEAASQIALRECSKAAVGEGQYIRFWWRGSSIPWSIHFTKGFLLVTRIWRHHEGFNASLDMRRKRVEIIKSVPKNYLKTCPTRFPGSQSVSLHPELPHGLLKVNSSNSTGVQSPWQMANAFVVHSLAMPLVSASL